MKASGWKSPIHSSTQRGGQNSVCQGQGSPAQTQRRSQQWDLEGTGKSGVWAIFGAK